MSVKNSKLNLVDNDELKNHEKENEETGLLKHIKKINLEINGLFFITTALVILGVSLTGGMIISIYFGPSQFLPHAGIASEVQECSALGLEICRKGGSAVDSAIGTLICLTIVRPDIISLGGCGSMLIHNHSSMISEVIDFSCVAPPSVKNDSINDGYGIPESVAIPGILSGLNLAHKNYGKMNVTEIMDLVIQTLIKGFVTTEQMKKSASSAAFGQLPLRFRELYRNWVSDSLFKPSDDLINIVRSLKFEGLMSGSIASEIDNLGFKWMNKLDTARKLKPLKVTFSDYSLLTAPLPSIGGLQIGISFEMLDRLLSKTDIIKETSEFYQKVLESLKVSQAYSSFLGDSDSGKEAEILSSGSINKFLKMVNLSKSQSNGNFGPYYLFSNIEKGSGTHISIIDSNHLFLSLSANIGSMYGSGISTKSGILLNDALRLFTPYDSNIVSGIQNRTSLNCNNRISPGKRPLNYLTPMMTYNFKRKCGIRFVVGAGRGVETASAGLQMVLGAIYLDQKFCPQKDCMDLTEAGSRPRIYTNLLTNHNSSEISWLDVERSFKPTILKDLEFIYKYTQINTLNVSEELFSVGKVQYEIQGYGAGHFISF